MTAEETTDPRGHFLATLNHEVRTPLSGILGMADLLLETRLDEEQRDYVKASRLCAENLLELLNATIEYSALLSDRIVLDESEFCAVDLLESVAGEFECKARCKGLRLVRSFQQGIPEMACGDAVRLRQILSHLLTNAIKFTLTGYVEMAASATPAEDDQISLRVSITDTGIGIPEEELRAVFRVLPAARFRARAALRGSGFGAFSRAEDYQINARGGHGCKQPRQGQHIHRGYSAAPGARAPSGEVGNRHYYSPHPGGRR